MKKVLLLAGLAGMVAANAEAMQSLIQILLYK